VKEERSAVMSSGIVNVSRNIRLLTQLGVQAMKPSYKHGQYIGPLISRRKAADLRKIAIKDGTFGSFTANVGGWDPTWDTPRKMFMLRPYKGHLSDRTREDRAKKIEAAMKAMPDRIAKFEKDIDAKRPRKDFTFYLKRMKDIATKKQGRPVGAVVPLKKKNDKNTKKKGKK
jgi:hypothetical protein